jgi:D-alanyl-D-alanine dipeptidase
VTRCVVTCATADLDAIHLSTAQRLGVDLGRFLFFLLVAACVGSGASASADVPPVSDAARAAGFVDVLSVVPDAIIDLRYATANNFTRAPLYPADARCLVHGSMAPGLAAAADALRPQN